MKQKTGCTYVDRQCSARIGVLLPRHQSVLILQPSPAQPSPAQPNPTQPNPAQPSPIQVNPGQSRSIQASPGQSRPIRTQISSGQVSSDPFSSARITGYSDHSIIQFNPARLCTFEPARYHGIPKAGQSAVMALHRTMPYSRPCRRDGRR